MHGEYPGIIARKCQVCDAYLTGQNTKICSPRCAGQIAGRNRRGKGSTSPYIRIRVGGKQVYLHRHIWETHNGRKLEQGEVVHHKDHDKRNNDPANLEALENQAEHLRRHDWLNNPDCPLPPRDPKFAEEMEFWGW